MLTTPWLSPEEVADLCDGLTQAAAQARYLKKAFGIECKRKPSGALLVFRYQLEPKAPPQRARTEPNRAALLALVGKRRYLGLHSDKAVAHQVYLDAKRKIHEGCTI